MNELEIRKIAKEEFISNVMNNLDSTLIFTYIQNLEQKVNNLQSKIDKANELIKRKLSTETYQHLKKLYDDIDSTEEIWEDYEFEDLLDILKEAENVKNN